MANIVKKIMIDCIKPNRFRTTIAKQGDMNSRFLLATIANDGVPISIESDATVIINGIRPDGETKSFGGTVNDDGTVTVPIPNWMLKIEGHLDCEIVIINPTTQERLSTTKFTVEVESLISDCSEIVDDDNHDFLLELITQVDTAVKSCNSAAESAITATENADKVIVDSKEAVEKANKSTESAESAAQRANDAADRAEKQSSIYPIKTIETSRINICDLSSGRYYLKNNTFFNNNTEGEEIELEAGTIFDVFSEADSIIFYYFGEIFKMFDYKNTFAEIFQYITDDTIDHYIENSDVIKQFKNTVDKKLIKSVFFNNQPVDISNGILRFSVACNNELSVPDENGKINISVPTKTSELINDSLVNMKDVLNLNPLIRIYGNFRLGQMSDRGLFNHQSAAELVNTFSITAADNIKVRIAEGYQLRVFKWTKSDIETQVSDNYRIYFDRLYTAWTEDTVDIEKGTIFTLSIRHTDGTDMTASDNPQNIVKAECMTLDDKYLDEVKLTSDFLKFESSMQINISTGAVSASNCTLSDYYEVTEDILVKAYTTYKTQAAIALYDENKNFIKGLNDGNFVVTNCLSTERKIEKDSCKYIRVSSRMPANKWAEIKRYVNAEEKINSLQSQIDEIKQMMTAAAQVSEQSEVIS